MRMYSDSERSSALASRDSASSSDGGMRSLISSVHFSGISSPQKDAGAAVVVLRRREARDIPAVANPGLTARGGETVRHGMSGGFMFLFGMLGSQDVSYLIGAQRWDIAAPLVNGLHRNAQGSRQFCDRPESGDGFT
jgi:hypothetical protein